MNHVTYSAAHGVNSSVSRSRAGVGRKINIASFLRLLIQAGFNLNVQDNDGWTPLHAAAHWGVKEACSILAEALCDMDIRNKLVSTHRCWQNLGSAVYSQMDINFLALPLDPTPRQSYAASSSPRVCAGAFKSIRK